MADWDYIIIGGGSAGAVIANRLSERPASRVLLLEAGGRDNALSIRVPAGEIKAIANPRYNWGYVADPDPSLNHRKLIWPAGKVLGGSSSINGMVYVRGQREDFDSWAQLLGNTSEWSYADVLTYFKKLETNPLGDSEFHGASGPMKVSNIARPHALAQVFIAAAQELGVPFNPDINGAQQEGVGPNQGTIDFGRRNNSSRAYLRPVRNRANLKIVTGALADSVMFEGTRAKGVRYFVNGSACEDYAGREVIVSAGALGSPGILMRSGIGAPEHLKQMGVPVISALNGVGQNLQDHPQVWISGHVNVSTYNVETTPRHLLAHGFNWLVRGVGPAAAPVSHAVAFLRTRPSDERRPDVQLHFVPVGYKVTETGVTLLDRPAVTIACCVLRPLSRSQVFLKDKDPRTPPRILSKLLSNEDDIDRLRRGLRLSRQIFESNAFAPYFQGAWRPSTDVHDDEQIMEFFRNEAEGSYHPAGTCKMGVGADAVVGKDLRVRGVEGLRVADASIMPTITSGNTNAPTLMIGEKAAALVLAAAA